MEAILLRMPGILILSQSKTGGMTQFPIKLSRGTVTGQPVVSASQKLLTGVDKGYTAGVSKLLNRKGSLPEHPLPTQFARSR
jgi:hypothetical protein